MTHNGVNSNHHTNQKRIRLGFFQTSYEECRERCWCLNNKCQALNAKQSRELVSVQWACNLHNGHAYNNGLLVCGHQSCGQYQAVRTWLRVTTWGHGKSFSPPTHRQHTLKINSQRCKTTAFSSLVQQAENGHNGAGEDCK